MELQEIFVESIKETKNKKAGYKTLMVRAITQKKSSAGSSLASMMLGGNTEENRVAFPTMSDTFIEEHNIAEGVNLNDVFPVNVRITITELTSSELAELPANDQRGYKAKINPITQEYLVKDGEYIYRKTDLTEATFSDKYISHNASVAKAPEEEVVNDLTA